jgi:hypothetical protein
MQHLFHQRDLYYLRTFGADENHTNLKKDYDRYRDCWDNASMKGELPQATLLELAKKYPVKKPAAKTETTKAEA